MTITGGPPTVLQVKDPRGMRVCDAWVVDAFLILSTSSANRGGLRVSDCERNVREQRMCCQVGRSNSAAFSVPRRVIPEGLNVAGYSFRPFRWGRLATYQNEGSTAAGLDACGLRPTAS